MWVQYAPDKLSGQERAFAS